MKISELVEKLNHMKEIHGDCEVYTARDEEWNGFNTVYSLQTQIFGNGTYGEDTYSLEEGEEMEDYMHLGVVIS